MWTQPYFNQPPNPLGGYILVPVGSNPTNTSVPSVSTKVKSRSLKKQLKEAETNRIIIDEHIKWLKDQDKKGDKKPDEKKEDKKLSLIHMTMLLMFSAPFLGLFELYCLKIMASNILAPASTLLK